MRLALHVSLIAHVLFCGHGHCAHHERVHASFFAYDQFIAGRTASRRKSGFQVSLFSGTTYKLRVRSRGLCWTTPITMRRAEGREQRITLLVPTKGETRCDTSVPR